MQLLVIDAFVITVINTAFVAAVTNVFLALRYLAAFPFALQYMFPLHRHCDRGD